MNLLKERVEGSESAQLAVAVEGLKKQVLEAEEQADAAKTKKQDLIATAKVCHIPKGLLDIKVSI